MEESGRIGTGIPTRRPAEEMATAAAKTAAVCQCQIPQFAQRFSAICSSAEPDKSRVYLAKK
jgi:hypothetical protein